MSVNIGHRVFRLTYFCSYQSTRHESSSPGELRVFDPFSLKEFRSSISDLLCVSLTPLALCALGGSVRVEGWVEVGKTGDR